MAARRQHTFGRVSTKLIDGRCGRSQKSEFVQVDSWLKLCAHNRQRLLRLVYGLPPRLIRRRTGHCNRRYCPQTGGSSQSQAVRAMSDAKRGHGCGPTRCSCSNRPSACSDSFSDTPGRARRAAAVGTARRHIHERATGPGRESRCPGVPLERMELVVGGRNRDPRQRRTAAAPEGGAHPSTGDSLRPVRAAADAGDRCVEARGPGTRPTAACGCCWPVVERQARRIR